MFGDEARQRMDHRQSLIACGHATASRLLQVLQKQSQTLGGDIADNKLIRFFFYFEITSMCVSLDIMMPMT